MDKLFVSFKDLMRDSVELANKVIESEYKPDFLVAVWRGGSFIGCVVQEVLNYAGIETDHIAVRTSCRRPDTSIKEQIVVHGTRYIKDRLKFNSKILVVDDVMDSGLSVKAIYESFNCYDFHSLRTAMIYYKPKNSLTGFKPDYFCHKTHRWLVFPHEFEGLGIRVIERTKGIKLKHFKSCDHSFAYTGEIPCTGVQKCRFCGEIKL